MHIPISERIADEFLGSLEHSFDSLDDVAMEDLYLSSSEKDGVPISYSQRLEPFVGRTRGYNPPEDRVHLSQDNFVLRAIQEALIDAGRRGVGARVFLTSTRAYCVDDGGEMTLVTWGWLGEDLEEEVAALAEKM
jgi:hypothetical protein